MNGKVERIIQYNTRCRFYHHSIGYVFMYAVVHVVFVCTIYCGLSLPKFFDHAYGRRSKGAVVASRVQVPFSSITGAGAIGQFYTNHEKNLPIYR